VGLTTALVALRSGFVIVGSLPTADGASATAQAGCLIVLNSSGVPVATISGNGINGPWDMTALDMDTAAVLFVTNVLNGTVAANGAVVFQGSILRIQLSLAGATPVATSFTTIASAFPERTDPAALVLGPTGVHLGADGTTLFVADTLQDRIAAIPDALTTTTDAGAGVTVIEGRALKQPLGLAIAPNGDILTVNGGNGQIVETTPDGMLLGARHIDLSHTPPGGAGTLFGLAVRPDGGAIYFVDDGDNTLNILQ
jgi:DNA-binding beta-propeller fold protein YncE